jgi:hypothetical protein
MICIPASFPSRPSAWARVAFASNGVRTSLEIVGRRDGYGVGTPVPSGQWHVLRCDFAGSRFKVTYDGQPLFEVEDTTIADAGRIGLWTKADSVTLFDDLTYGESK